MLLTVLFAKEKQHCITNTTTLAQNTRNDLYQSRLMYLAPGKTPVSETL